MNNRVIIIEALNFSFHERWLTKEERAQINKGVYFTLGLYGEERS